MPCEIAAPRFGCMEDQVVEPVVTVHECCRVAGRNVQRQPLDQALHRVDVLGLGSAVLRAPAADLAGEEVAGFAVVGQTDLRRVEAVQRGDHAVHVVEQCRAFSVRETGQRRVPKSAALHVLHHVERTADQSGIAAQAVHLWHRHARVAQRVHLAVFALDRVGRGQQLARRLVAQHVTRRPSFQQVGRVRLPAFELLNLQRPGEPRHVPCRPGLERGQVETVPFLHGHRAHELLARPTSVFS